LFGDTVNVANRMESASESMKVHISETTKQALPPNRYRVVEHSTIEVKGQGELRTHFVLCKIDDDGKSIKCPFMEVYQEGKRAEAMKKGSQHVFLLNLYFTNVIFVFFFLHETYFY
jgi:hypothetical protein